MDLMGLLLMLHSLVRWVIVIVTVVALVRFLLVWLGNQPEKPYDNTIMTVFVRVAEVQMLLGLIYLLWSGAAGAGFSSYRIEHTVTMFIAVIVAHLPRRWRNAPARTRARNNVIVILVVLVLVYVGVARLPLGWSR